MPYARKTLTQLQADVAADLGGGSGTLRWTVLGILGRAQAGLANLHYGYLDWIALQAVPFSATDEYLEGWAALKGVVRKPATTAAGTVNFNGAPGSVIPAGTVVLRTDGLGFTTSTAGVISAGGTATVPVSANPDLTGQGGAIGNTPVGAGMVLNQSIVGVQSNGVVATALAGGADIESDGGLRSRMLDAYQAPRMGGSKKDYEDWAKAVPGVTRAWCVPNGFGVGTVVLYVMLDLDRSATGGVPQGTNGTASSETRGVTATGDQLAVANALYAVQPAQALVYVVAPVAKPFDLVLSGIAASLQASASAAIASVLQAQGAPGTTVPYGNIWAAVNAVVGNNFFTIAPSADIVCLPGQIPVPGNVTFA